MQQSLRRKTRREEMRLLYVAMTRAQNKLFVTGTVSKDFDMTKDTDLADSYAEWLIKTLSLDTTLEVDEEVDLDSETKILAVSDDTIKRDILENFDYVYPHIKATQTPLKHTATGLSKITYEDSDDAPTYVIRDEYKYDVDTGNLYHKIMQHISLEVSKEDIDRELDILVQEGILSIEERGRVDVSIVAKAISTPTIREAINRGARVYTERSFISKLRGSDIGLEVDDEILVQGVIDLLLVEEDGFSIVDYKFSRASSQTLASRYRRQIDVYRLSTSRILGIRCKKSVIYSFATGIETEI